MTNPEYTFDALRVVQPIGEFYVSVIPAHILLSLSHSKMLRLADITPDGEYDLSGSQRPLKPSRLKEIGNYIDTVEAAFPNSIILAANYTEDGDLVEEEDLRWKVNMLSDSNVGNLIIPTQQRLASIVDGQHRLFGFKHASDKSRKQMPLICAVLLDLPNPYQAQIFATINYNQKPVNKSLAYELYGFNIEDENPEEWSPEKVAVFICRKLNAEILSPFKDHIIVGAQDDRVLDEIAKQRRLKWSVSTATIVEGIMRLISQKPQRDRDAMHRYPSGKGRKREIAAQFSDKSSLRQAYIEGNDLLVYTVVHNYFIAASKVFDFDRANRCLKKTVGIQALFDILRRASKEAYESKNVSEEYFFSLLSDASQIDFSDSFIYASGAGRIKIRNTLESAIRWKTE